MTKKVKKHWLSQRAAEAGLWDFFEDFVTDGTLLSFCDHAGIDLRGVDADRAWNVFRDCFTVSGRIDMEAFLTKFQTWGPIASRIVELQLESKCQNQPSAA